MILGPINRPELIQLNYKFTNFEMKTFEKAASVVQTSKDFHQALQRNGYFVPKFETRICTEAFMLGIRNQKIFVP